MGFLWLSTVPLTAGLVTLFFGARYMGMLYGVAFFSHQVGSFVGVWLGGYAFDVTGSYAMSGISVSSSASPRPRSICRSRNSPQGASSPLGPRALWEN